MRSIVGITIGAACAIAFSYIFALLAGTAAVGLVLVPLGIILGWRIGAAWGTAKPCPDCRKQIDAAATTCPHCGRKFEPTHA
jgi:uncharacterized protein (UPF0212 family)